MINSEFDYAAPQSLDKALSMIETSTNVAILSGGYSLISFLKANKVRPSLVIDTRLIPSLDNISVTSDGNLEVGASVNLADLTDNHSILTTYPVLSEAINHIADRQLLYQTNIGDSFFYESIGFGILAVLRAYGAKFIYKSKNNSKIVENLLPSQAAMLLTGIRLAKSLGKVTYNQIISPVSRIPLFGVVSNLEINHGIIKDAKIIIFGEDISVSNVEPLEAKLIGSSVEGALGCSYDESYISAVTAQSSCSSAYLLNLLKVYIEKALTSYADLMEPIS